MTSNTRKKGNSDKTLGILLSKFEKNYYARCVYNLDLRDHSCSFQKAKIINKDLMMMLF